MLFEMITPIAIALGMLAVVHFAKTRSAAAANGTPVSQVNLFPDRWAEPLRPLPRRRLLAGVWLALLASAVVAICTGADYTPFVTLAFWWVGIAIANATRTMAERNAKQLDERMVAARNRAFRTAYYVVGGTMAASLLIAGLAARSWNSSGIMLDNQALAGTSLLTVLVVMYLPSVILAWTEDVI